MLFTANLLPQNDGAAVIWLAEKTSLRSDEKARTMAPNAAQKQNPDSTFALSRISFLLVYGDLMSRDMHTPQSLTTLNFGSSHSLLLPNND